MQIKEFTSQHWTIDQSKVGTHADEDTKIHAQKQGNHTTRVAAWLYSLVKIYHLKIKCSIKIEMTLSLNFVKHEKRKVKCNSKQSILPQSVVQSKTFVALAFILLTVES